jgi:hypothetical protein
MALAQSRPANGFMFCAGVTRVDRAFLPHRGEDEKRYLNLHRQIVLASEGSDTNVWGVLK